MICVCVSDEDASIVCLPNMFLFFIQFFQWSGKTKIKPAYFNDTKKKKSYQAIFQLTYASISTTFASFKNKANRLTMRPQCFTCCVLGGAVMVVAAVAVVVVSLGMILCLQIIRSSCLLKRRDRPTALQMD